MYANTLTTNNNTRIYISDRRQAPVLQQMSALLQLPGPPQEAGRGRRRKWRRSERRQKRRQGKGRRGAQGRRRGV